MSRPHPGLPKPTPLTLTKSSLLLALKGIDADRAATQRVLTMETGFRSKIDSHIASLPIGTVRFSDQHTNPFVLLMYARRKNYTYVGQVEEDLLQSKVFSSMETSAGKMVEKIALPVYGWQDVPSEMHTSESVLDGKKKTGDAVRLLTLKSGPRTLNDPISSSIASDVVRFCTQWAATAGVSAVDFTYGALYGTKKASTKKDWHILRRIEEALPARAIEVAPAGRWDCRFRKGKVTVNVAVRLGVELWDYIAGRQGSFVELAAAIIRSCITPRESQPADHPFSFSDLPAVVSLDCVPPDFNVSILQRSQLEWLFFFARHFCDRMVDG
jgi:hypothetical protein